MSNPYQESGPAFGWCKGYIVHQTATELIGTHLEKGKVYFQEFMKGVEEEEESIFYEWRPSWKIVAIMNFQVANRVY